MLVIPSDLLSKHLDGSLSFNDFHATVLSLSGVSASRESSTYLVKYIHTALGVDCSDYLWLSGKGYFGRKDPEACKRVYDFYAASGLALEPFAKSVGLSENTLRRYLLLHGFKTIRRPSLHLSKPEIRAKIDATSLERYGTINPGASASVQAKIKATTKLRHGVSNAMQSPALAQKQRDSLMASHGVTSPLQSKEIYSRMEATNLQRYGSKNVFSSPEVRRQMKRTLVQRYGFEYPLQSPRVIRKMEETNLRRYGVSNVGSAPEVIERKFKAQSDRLYQCFVKMGYELLSPYVGSRRLTNGTYQSIQYKIKHLRCGSVYESTLTQFPYNRVPHCPVCYPLQEYRSRLEVSLEEFIQSLGFECSHARKMIPLGSNSFGDIDIYIPSLRVGFEVNGLYYHSVHNELNCSAKYVDYHQQKTIGALSKGIRLYHIWDYAPLDIVKSMISNGLHKPLLRIFARHLSVAEVSASARRDFYQQSHLHSDANSLFSLGLVGPEATLIQCISFRRTGDPTVLEISRSATALNCQVVGGFSKLLSHSIDHIRQHHPSIRQILTYADRDWSPVAENTVYAKCGFQYLGDSGPSMFYTDFRNVYSRQRFQKHKLKALFPEAYSDSLTEQQILATQKIYPFYNAGNHKFVYTL